MFPQLQAQPGRTVPGPQPLGRAHHQVPPDECQINPRGADRFLLLFPLLLRHLPAHQLSLARRTRGRS